MTRTRRPHLLFAASLLVAGNAWACAGTVLDTEMGRLMGDAQSLCAHYGDVVLVVNTASQCGFTPQYAGLETLYQRYRDQGFTVIGVPSDQFAGQEFDDNAEIATFCRVNYGVSFPMLTRSAVKGPEAVPLYRGLTKATGVAPQWNFHKYLIGRDGRVLGQWPSMIEPQSAPLIDAIEAALTDQAR
jgi:glutathione peroxidase